MKKDIFYKPVFERQKKLDESLKLGSKKTVPLLKGKKAETITTVEMPIEYLLYRIENLRTESLQESFIAKNNEKAGYFRDHAETPDIQFKQHELLLPLTKKGNPSTYDYFKSNIQTEPILINNRSGEHGTAVVINGNRRLATWRQLYYEDPIEFAHFALIQCDVLPSNFDQENESDLEYQLQIAQDIKEEYNWINDRKAKLKKIERLTNKGVSQERAIKEVAKESNITEARLKTELEAFALGKKYLDNFLNKSNQWNEIEADEQAFSSLAQSLNKKSETDQAWIETLGSQIIAGETKGASKHNRIMFTARRLMDVGRKIQNELPPLPKQKKSKSSLKPAAVHGNPYEGYSPGELSELIGDAIDELLAEDKLEKSQNHAQELNRIQTTIKTTNRKFDKTYSKEKIPAYIVVIDECIKELEDMKAKLEGK